MPERDAQGFPVITLDQARRDLAQVRDQVTDLLFRAGVRLAEGDAVRAYALQQDAASALDWLADRLAITEGGTLGRHPRAGGDTPPAEGVAGATPVPD